MRVLVLLATLSACSFVMPPRTGGKPPTGCRATPAVDLVAGIGFAVAVFVARSRADGEAKEDVKRAVTALYGIPAVGFLGAAAIGFNEYAGCRREAVPPPPPPMIDGRRCAPDAPGSSVWTCGPGLRCTDDFASCEPADGRPTLRQR